MNAPLSTEQPRSFFCSETQVNPERPVSPHTTGTSSLHRHNREYCPNCCSQEQTRIDGDEVLCRHCGWTIKKVEERVPATAEEWFARIRKVIADTQAWRRA